MRKALLLTAAVLALTAGQALAKKQLVIVVKGLDNPFFEAINQGCQKWNKENPTAEYECFYTGPASTSDEAEAKRRSFRICWARQTRLQSQYRRQMRSSSPKPSRPPIQRFR